jgi:hypothetical protein
MKLALILIGLVVIQMIAFSQAQGDVPTGKGEPIQMKYPVEGDEKNKEPILRGVTFFK